MKQHPMIKFLLILFFQLNHFYSFVNYKLEIINNLIVLLYQIHQIFNEDIFLPYKLHYQQKQQ